MTREQMVSRPRQTGKFVALLVVTGLLASFFGFWGFQERSTGGLSDALTGLAIGNVVGVTGGILLMNKLLKYRGSSWRGLAGGLLGGVVCIAIVKFLPAFYWRLTVQSMAFWLLLLVFLLAPIALAMIGLHWKRRGK